MSTARTKQVVQGLEQMLKNHNLPNPETILAEALIIFYDLPRTRTFEIVFRGNRPRLVTFISDIQQLKGGE